MGINSLVGAAGIGGALAGLFGGSSMPSAPPQFQMPNMGPAANNAFQGIGGLSSTFGGAANNTLAPASSTFSSLYNNPYAGMLQTGAGVASPMGQNAALSGYNTGGSLNQAGLSTIPMANTIFQTSLDPQQALFNQTSNTLQNQTLANLENSGLATSPYGQGVLGYTMGQFDMGWENNQLARMTQGASAAGNLMTQGAGISNTGIGMQNAAPGQYLNASSIPFSTFGAIGGAQNQAISSYLGNTGGAESISNLPIQDYLGYIGAGNQANSVANQNYGLQLQAQQQQFNQSMQLGAGLGLGLYGLGAGLGGFGGSGVFGGFNYNNPSFTAGTGLTGSDFASAAQAGVASGLTFNPLTGEVS